MIKAESEGNDPQKRRCDQRENAHRPDKFQRVLDMVADGDISKAKADIHRRHRGADRGAEGSRQQESGGHSLCGDTERCDHADDAG